MLSFRYDPISNNVYSRHGKKIEYIVIHDTGNTGVGANARNHKNYMQNNTRGASAHYFVDDKEIVQYVGDSRSAGAVGDGKGKYGITNQNSLSIELCINRDGDYNKAFNNLVELTKNLMVKFNIPADRVVRHYDASRKNCPGSMRANNWAKWREFKKAIAEPIKIKLDLSKDSVGVLVNSEAVNMDKEYIEVDGLMIAKIEPDRAYLQFIGGKTIRQTGAEGINGPFFGGDVTDPKSVWAIAVNNNKPIGPNAHINHPDKSTKRGTIYMADGQVNAKRVNSTSEIDGYINWAVGGLMLYPDYNPDKEQIAKDILRTANHTAVAYDGEYIYLIASESMSMEAFKDRIVKNIKDIKYAVALDGGGSTQLYYVQDGVDKGIHSNRRLPSMIGIKAKTDKPKPKEHWAEKHYKSLVDRGLDIKDKRYDDPMTRGEVFAILDKLHNTTKKI